MFGDDYQKECDKFITRSINLDSYLQKIRTNTPSTFDEKQYYINEVRKIP